MVKRNHPLVIDHVYLRETDLVFRDVDGSEVSLPLHEALALLGWIQERRGMAGAYQAAQHGLKLISHDGDYENAQTYYTVEPMREEDIQATLDVATKRERDMWKRTPQYPDGSGWDSLKVLEATIPYFYEQRINRDEVGPFLDAAAAILYKIVTHETCSKAHKNTYFVVGNSDLMRFLEHNAKTREYIVSIEQVERMPSTDEKLT